MVTVTRGRTESQPASIPRLPWPVPPGQQGRSRPGDGHLVVCCTRVAVLITGLSYSSPEKRIPVLHIAQPSRQVAARMSRVDPTSVDERPLGVTARRTVRWCKGTRSAIVDSVAEEVPVAMRYNGEPFSVMMATPSDLEDLALGFSLTEGLITDASELIGVEVRPCIEGIELHMQVSLAAPAATLSAASSRALPGRSGCGLCGARLLEDVVRLAPPIQAPSTFPLASLRLALSSLPAMQPLNLASGSTHAAAWVELDGRISRVREDVGRHNALDKLVGGLRRGSVSTEAGLALISSRASYEMVSKAAHAGMAVVAAVSAPTALAIDLANAAGICLIGFARRDRFNVYSHPERLLGFEDPNKEW